MPKRSLFSGVSQSTRKFAGKMFLTSLSVSAAYCFSKELKNQFKSVSDELSLPSNRVAFSAEQELKRMFACDVKDLQPGQMKEIQTGPDEKKDTVVVANVDGKVYCVGSKCSHFGAPMSKGMLFGDRIFCPWHLASFSVITGFPDFGPVFNGLPSYKAEVHEGKVYITVPEKNPSGSVQTPMVKDYTSCSNEKMVVSCLSKIGSKQLKTMKILPF